MVAFLEMLIVQMVMPIMGDNEFKNLESSILLEFAACQTTLTFEIWKPKCIQLSHLIPHKNQIPLIFCSFSLIL